MNSPERPKQQTDLEAPFVIGSFEEAATALHAVQLMQADPDEHHRLSLPSRVQRGKDWQKDSVTLGDLVERDEKVYEKPAVFTDGDAILIRGALQQLAKREKNSDRRFTRVSGPAIGIARRMLEREAQPLVVREQSIRPTTTKPMTIPLELARELEEDSGELGSTGEIPMVEKLDLISASRHHTNKRADREPVAH